MTDKERIIKFYNLYHSSSAYSNKVLLDLNGEVPDLWSPAHVCIVNTFSLDEIKTFSDSEVDHLCKLAMNIIHHRY